MDYTTERFDRRIYNPAQLVVVSYFTDDPLYSHEVAYLIDSLRRFEINYTIDRVTVDSSKPKFAEGKTYTQLSKLKPVVLQAALEEFERVVWVDCDAMFFRYPDELEQLTDLNLGLCRNRITKKFALLSGVIYLRQSELTTSLLSEWLDRGFGDDLDANDQTSLEQVVIRRNLPYYSIPQSYIEKYDEIQTSPDYPAGVTVVHYMASRRAAAQNRSPLVTRRMRKNKIETFEQFYEFERSRIAKIREDRFPLG